MLCSRRFSVTAKAPMKACASYGIRHRLRLSVRDPTASGRPSGFGFGHPPSAQDDSGRITPHSSSSRLCRVWNPSHRDGMESALCAVWNPRSCMASAKRYGIRALHGMESALCAVWNPSHRDGMESAIGGMASALRFRLRAFLRLPCPRLLFLLGGGL